MSRTNGRVQSNSALNDSFRRRLKTEGRLYLTEGVNMKGADFVARALAEVIAFNDFDNTDARDEHNWGRFQVDNEDLVWRLDCYPIPNHKDETVRIVSIMLSNEF